MKKMKKKIFFLSFFLLSFSLNQIVFADRVAIIGGGASGLLSAWLIENQHQVTLYEARDRLGGHANTVMVNVDGQTLPIEGGVDFFNRKFYPNFTKLLDYFNIPLKQFALVMTFYHTDGSNVVILPPYHEGKVEWQSLEPDKWKLLVQLGIVLDKARKLIKHNDMETTLQEALHGPGMTYHFKNEFLFPLVSTGWGVSRGDIVNFSAYNTLKYLVDSYDLGFNWFEVQGGVSTYIKAVTNTLTKTNVRLNTRVTNITRKNGIYFIEAQDGSVSEFDKIVFAVEPIFIGKLLANLTEHSLVVDAIAKTKFIHAKVAIHGDTRFMPPDPADWRVANVRFDGLNSQLTIYKSWKCSNKPIFKSWINLDVRPDHGTGDPIPSPLYYLFDYYHSFTDKNYFAAQRVTAQEQGKNNIYFAGLWTNYRDVHESAVVSAINIAKMIAPYSERLRVFQ